MASINVNPDSFNKIYTTSYIHGQNEDIASAYLGAIDNTPRYNDATFDYKVYLTKSLNTSSTLDKSLFSLEFLYKNKIDSILNDTFKLNFLYDSNRSIKDIYPNIENVRANNSIGIFDLSTCFYTTNYTKKLPLTSTFENTKFKEFLENNPNYFDTNEISIDNLVDTEKFKEKSSSISIDTYKSLHGCKKIFYYNAPKRNDKTGSILTLRKPNNTYVSYFYDGNNLKLIKLNTKYDKENLVDNIQFLQIDYNKDTNEYYGLIRVDFEEPELFYSKDLYNWNIFIEINKNNKEITSDFNSLDDSDRINIESLWDYTNITRMPINILNMWEFDGLTIVAYNEKNSDKIESISSNLMNYMYSTDNKKTWNKCDFDSELVDILKYSIYSKSVKLEKIDNKYYLYSGFGLNDNKYLENSSTETKKYGLFISEDGIEWKAFKDCKVNTQVYKVIKIDDSVFIATKNNVIEDKKCNAPETENHEHYINAYNSYNLYRLTSDSIHTVDEYTLYNIDDIFTFDDKIIIVYFNCITQMYTLKIYNPEDNTSTILLSDIKAYSYLNFNKALIYTSNSKDIRYAYSINEIDEDTAKTSNITIYKKFDEWKIENFIKLKDDDDGYDLGVVLRNNTESNLTEPLYNIGWSKDIKTTITTEEDEEPIETPKKEINFTVLFYGSDQFNRWGTYDLYRLIDNASNPNDKILLLFRADSYNNSSLNICYSDENKETYLNFDVGNNIYSQLFEEIKKSSSIKYIKNEDNYYLVTDNHFIKLNNDFKNVVFSKSSNTGFILTKDNLLYTNNYEYEIYDYIVPTKKIEYFFAINNKIFTMGEVNNSFVYYGNTKNHTIISTDHISKDYHLFSNCKLVGDNEVFTQNVIWKQDDDWTLTKYYDTYCYPNDFVDFIASPRDPNSTNEDDQPKGLIKTPPYEKSNYYTITKFNTYDSYLYASSIMSDYENDPDYVSFDDTTWYEISREEVDDLGDLYMYKGSLISINANEIRLYSIDPDNKLQLKKVVNYFNRGDWLPNIRNEETSTYQVKDVLIDTNQFISILFQNDGNSTVILTMNDLFEPITCVESSCSEKNLVLLDDKRFLSIDNSEIYTSYSNEVYNKWISGIKEYFEYYKINYALDKYYNKLIDDFEKDFKELTSEYLTFYDFITKFGISSDKHSASKIVKLYNHIIKMQEFIAFTISIHETIEKSFKLYSKYFENKEFDYTRLCKKDFVVVPHIYNVIWSIIDTRLSKLSSINSNTEVFNYFSRILIKENSTFDKIDSFKKYELLDPIRESASNGSIDNTNNNMDKVYSVLTQNYCLTMNILNNYDPFNDSNLTTLEEKYNKKFIKYLYMATLVLQIFDVISSTSSVNKSLDALSFDTIMQVLRIDYKKNYSDEEVFDDVINNLNK